MPVSNVVGVEIELRHLDLFSGIGGFALAAQWTWGKEYVNVGHSEIEKHCCQIYHKHFPESKCFGDITRVDWSQVKVELVTGGFPCQSFSVAGKRRGKEDDRYLWPPMFDAIRAIHPRLVVVENVPGLDDKIHLALDGCISDLEGEGYEVAPPFWIPACAVDAPHRRDRVWIVAYPHDERCNGAPLGFDTLRQPECMDAKAFRLPKLPESPVCGVDDGVPYRVDRLRALGNAIVPQVAFVILSAIKQYEQHK